MKIALCLLLLGCHCRAAFLVATAGDSFADALYLAMKVRADLLKRHDIEIVRWSRANIGFTRLDFFDYPGWLRDNSALGQADLCVVQIGSNDLQSIRTGKYQWAFFATDPWKELYAARVAGMLATLEQNRCKQVAWVLPPAFEGNPVMAKGSVPVSQVQADVVASGPAVAFDVVTSEGDYQSDNIHYGRDLMLRMGPALVEVVEATRDLIEGRCLACHGPRVADQMLRARKILPLRVHAQKSSLAK